MTHRAQLTLACVGIYVMGIASGALLISSISTPSYLEHFFVKTTDAQKMALAVMAKYNSKYALTPDEQGKLEPILRDMCETLYQTRSHFGIDVLKVEDDYHTKMAAVMTPDHKTLFLSSYQKYRARLSEALLASPAPTSPPFPMTSLPNSGSVRPTIAENPPTPNSPHVVKVIEPAQNQRGTGSKKRSGLLSFFIWFLILAAALGSGVYFGYGPVTAYIQSRASGGSKHGKQQPLPPVVVATAHKGPISVYDEGLGAVTPEYSVTVKTRVAGQLMSVNFQEGQTVKAGDSIADIDPRPYQVMLEQGQAQLLHDQAILQNAQTDLQRYQTLWNQNSISQQTLATQQATVTQDQGTVASDQANIDSVKLNLVYCHITSPITGQVGLRLVDPGNYVQPSDSSGLIVINQIEPITVIFTIAEDSIPPILRSLKQGDHLPVTALDRAKVNTLAEGTLFTSDNQIDPTTGTLRLRATFANTDHSLFPNQFVNARLLVKTKPSVLLIPTAAIQTGQSGSFVYTVQSDQTVAMKPVTTGVSDSQDVEILTGLNEGDSVIIEGVDKLQDGAKVEVTQPSAAGSTASTSPDGTTPVHHHHHHTTDGSSDATPPSSSSGSPAPNSAPATQ